MKKLVTLFLLSACTDLPNCVPAGLPTPIGTSIMPTPTGTSTAKPQPTLFPIPHIPTPLGLTVPESVRPGMAFEVSMCGLSSFQIVKANMEKMKYVQASKCFLVTLFPPSGKCSANFFTVRITIGSDDEVAAKQIPCIEN